MADLEAVAEFIALDNAPAANRFVQRVFKGIERLERFPKSGRRVPELSRTVYREVVIPPCRVFYRKEGTTVFILHVMRSERLLSRFLLDERNRTK